MNEQNDNQIISQIIDNLVNNKRHALYMSGFLSEIYGDDYKTHKRRFFQKIKAEGIADIVNDDCIEANNLTYKIFKIGGYITYLKYLEKEEKIDTNLKKNENRYYWISPLLSLIAIIISIIALYFSQKCC